LVICPTEWLGAPDALYRLMVAERIDIADFVPAVLRRLCEHLEESGERLDFLSTCICCGDILYARDYRRLRALCSSEAQLVNSYGITETAIHSTLADHIDDASAGDAIVSIGRPMTNVRIYVLDQALQPVPVGVHGELCVGGLGVGEGYIGRPELTAEKFVEVSLLGQPERIYRSGDLGRWRPSGELEFLGRLDYQVKLRGNRIELGEIEAALLQYPAVREAVVMLRGTDTNPMLVAWLALDDMIDDVSHALREFLGDRLPRYMLPASFVVLPGLPTTPNGKLDRHSLPDPTIAEDHRMLPPRDGIELELTLIWENLLGRAPIGVTEDFFALGGDSLLIVRLISLIEKKLGARVPLHTLFEASTIERLATVLRRESASTPWAPLVCLQPAGEASPLFFVHAAGGIVFRYLQVAALLGTNRPFYGLQARGIEPGDSPYPSIETMATNYVEAIRRVQPRGPYLLGGWSFGGTVAFEMTRQFEAQGETVSLLLMVDAPSPHVDDYEQDDVEFLLERLGPAAGLALAKIDGIDSREAKLHYLFEEQRLAGLFSPDISDADARLRLSLHKHHNKIGCRYDPAGPCRAKLVFFEPTESIPFDQRMKHPVPAWRELAGGGMEVDSAPGNHFNMFSADNGPVLAEKLRGRIAAIE